jgi:hypothetical protein
LLAGERVTFRRRRQTASEPVLLDPMVFIGIVVRLFAPAFVFAMAIPLAVASATVLVVTPRIAARWSADHLQPPLFAQPLLTRSGKNGRLKRLCQPDIRAQIVAGTNFNRRPQIESRARSSPNWGAASLIRTSSSLIPPSGRSDGFQIGFAKCGARLRVTAIGS